MKTIIIDGYTCTSAREIESHYKLDPKKVWLELKKLALPFYTVNQLRFYDVDKITAHFDMVTVRSYKRAVTADKK